MNLEANVGLSFKGTDCETSQLLATPRPSTSATQLRRHRRKRESRRPRTAPPRYQPRVLAVEGELESAVAALTHTTEPPGFPGRFKER